MNIVLIIVYIWDENTNMGMQNFFKTLNFKAEIQDVDFEKRTVTGYFSKFGNIDSDNDIIVSGAFARTIRENGPEGKNRIKHLKNHNPNQMIGKVVELKEDSIGLFFKSIMSTNVPGTDALIEYQEKMLTEHSIGFITLQSDQTDDGITLIKEVKLFEGSAVTWGSNPDTPVLDIKGMTYPQLADELDSVVKYCKVGGLSDELLSSVEIKIRQIQQEISERKEAAIIEEAPEQPEVDLLAIFNKELKNN